MRQQRNQRGCRSQVYPSPKVRNGWKANINPSSSLPHRKAVSDLQCGNEWINVGEIIGFHWERFGGLNVRRRTKRWSARSARARLDEVPKRSAGTRLASRDATLLETSH